MLDAAEATFYRIIQKQPHVLIQRILVGPDHRYIYGMTDLSESPLSLQEAAAIGDFVLVRSLIEKERNRGWLFEDCPTPCGNQWPKDVAEFLLAKDADVNARDSFIFAPLHYASQNGHSTVVELLIARGADINAKNDDGQTPLDIALSLNRKDIVELLMAKGATISFIHAAAQAEDLAGVKFSLEGGAPTKIVFRLRYSLR